LTASLYKANMANMLVMTPALRWRHTTGFTSLTSLSALKTAGSAFCVRTAVGTTLPVDLPSLASFLCCVPSLIAQATPKRPNGQGKARLLINFKDHEAAAAAAVAPMAYPFIHHFPGGQPPAQGSPYISVDTATVTELL
jgi:hypothetical protein